MSRRNDENKKASEDAYLNGLTDGRNDSLSCSSHYNGKPREQSAYEMGYIDGTNQRVEREKEERERVLIAQARQKHEEKIDVLIDRIGDLATAISHVSCGVYYDIVQRRKALRETLLELIPPPEL